MSTDYRTIEEWEARMGEQVRALRLRRNLEQASLAESAGVGISAIKNLEGGKGSTLKTLIRVARILGRQDWLESLAPPVTISPLQMAKGQPQRVRASRQRKKAEK